jgi:AraC-like DNA-binding protein
LTFPGERHGTGASPEGKGVLFWMLVRLPQRPGRFLSLPPDQSRALIAAIRDMPHRHFAGGDGLGKTLDRIMDVFQRSDDPLRITELQNLLLRFLLDLVAASRRASRRISPLIQSIQLLIERSAEERLSVGQLAARAGLSTSRFKARFKKETGIPPADYMMRQKIARALELLRSSDVSITQVALRLGFSTPQYFATVLKRYTGQSPGQARVAAKACREDVRKES